MKFIKRKVNPHYLSDLGSMNDSKCIIGPSVSLLTVPVFLKLECSACCSRVRSQQMLCILSLQIQPCVKAIHESEHFLLVWMCSFMRVCVFVCLFVCLCMWYIQMYMFTFACVLWFFLCVCLDVRIWHTDFCELH